MDDNQIYTSARSEEIKRQIKAVWEKSKKALADRAKKQRTKSPPKEHPVKPETLGNVAKDKVREKPQNIQISSEPSGTIKNDKLKKSKFLDRREAELNAREKVFSFFVYILLAIIVLIIALGIFLPVFKK